VFHKDVGKVDRDVAHFTKMAIHVCFKCMFHIFYPTYIASVLFGDVAKLDRDVAYIYKCFRCFYTMLQVFHFDVCIFFALATHVFSSFSGVLQVFQTYAVSVSAISDICCKCFI
jgi:hypothetical protein